jgi:hypothetical protein
MQKVEEAVEQDGGANEGLKRIDKISRRWV